MQPVARKNMPLDVKITNESPFQLVQEVLSLLPRPYDFYNLREYLP